MKKTTILMAMAALVLSSCAKNEVSESMPIANDPKMISFNSSIGTRADASGLTEVEGGFNVLGLKKDQTPTNAFINGTDATSTYLFTGSPKVWGWQNPADKNWPEATGEYPLTFYAEYPKVANMGGNTNLNKAIDVPLAMDAQTDFLIAKSLVDKRPSSGFAPLQFKHILSNLVFKIETAVGYTVHIQSIRVVNTAKDGRTFDYATMAYETPEFDYQPANLAETDGTFNVAKGYFFNNTVTTAPETPWSFTGATGVDGTIGTVPAEDGIMMQMPQLEIPYWTKAVADEGLDAFEKNAAAWKAANGTIDDWFGKTVADGGMQGSKGWEGARIEVIYRIYDAAANSGTGASVIGRQKDEMYTPASGTPIAAPEDLFVRVGFPLDLSAIKDKATGNTSVGWEMAKRYTYTIQLGTASATNGIVLDPDYKTADGESRTPVKDPIDNPKVDPGTPVTPGTINFNVGVDEWENNAQGIK